MSLYKSFEQNFNNFKIKLNNTVKKLDGRAKVTLPTTWVSVENYDKNLGSLMLKPSEPIIMKGVSQKGNKVSKRLCLYMSGYIIINGKQADGKIKISKYNTQLLYCDPEQRDDYRRLKVSGGFHFDFECNPQPVHPIFHMQLDNTVLREEVSADTAVQHVTPLVGENRCFRVPTSQMDIFSTLVMVVADHFVDKGNAEECDSFMNFVKDIQAHSLCIDMGECTRTFGGHLSTMTNMNSSSWYCERPQINV